MSNVRPASVGSMTAVCIMDAEDVVEHVVRGTPLREFDHHEFSVPLGRNEVWLTLRNSGDAAGMQPSGDATILVPTDRYGEIGRLRARTFAHELFGLDADPVHMCRPSSQAGLAAASRR